MKSLHVEAGRHYYGGARQVRYLVEGLAARGQRCVLAVPTGSALAGMAWSPGVVLVPMPMGGELDLRLVGRLTRLIRASGTEVVHLHSRRGADWLGGLAARRAGVPSVLTRRVDNREPRLVAAVKYRLFDRVVAISEAVAAVLRQAGADDSRLAVVPSGVDPAAVATVCDRAAFRAGLGLPPSGPLIGMVAQFIPRKGHALLLSALPAVLAGAPDTHVVLFGRGPLEAAVRARVEAAGLAGRVVFAGFREDLEALYACLDLLVHPASEEGLGVALLQAGAAGRPVVACRAGGVPEVVVHGETGLLVEPGDAAGLAAAMLALAGDPARRDALGEAARRRVVARFSVDAMVEAYLRLYAELASAGLG